MIRERNRETKAPGDVPADWENGSGLFREGTAHLKNDSGLLGRTLRRGDKIAAWAYRKGNYLYLGEFDTHLRAQQVILGR